MKTNTLFAAFFIALLNALALVPAFALYAGYFIAGAIALSLWLALKAAVYKGTSSEAPIEPAPAPPAAEAVPAAPPPKPAAPPRAAAEAEVLAVLGSFQSKGRLLDFLMDDISKYSDAQVGSAARVVHQGCKAACEELFVIAPISNGQEGGRVTVSADEVSDYRLLGNVNGEPPFSGVLVHKGWKATKVNLPRVIKVDRDRLPPIAPAQVELK